MDVKELMELMDIYGIEYELNADAEEVEASINQMRCVLVEEGLLDTKANFSNKVESLSESDCMIKFNANIQFEYDRNASLPLCA